MYSDAPPDDQPLSVLIAIAYPPIDARAKASVAGCRDLGQKDTGVPLPPRLKHLMRIGHYAVGLLSPSLVLEVSGVPQPFDTLSCLPPPESLSSSGSGS